MDIIDTVAKAGVNIFVFARYCPINEEKEIGITPQEYSNLLVACDKKIFDGKYQKAL